MINAVRTNRLIRILAFFRLLCKLSARNVIILQSEGFCNSNPIDYLEEKKVRRSSENCVLPAD